MKRQPLVLIVDDNEDVRERSIPVLMLTAHAFPDVQGHARSVGGDGYIAKPCLPDELVEHVRAALRRSLTEM